MSAIAGEELILYLFNEMEPIVCDESFTLNITANEIITTTKGSGRSTNREYGSYDWNIQCTGVMLKSVLATQTDPRILGDVAMQGRKVIVKANIRSDYFFGIGIITSISYIGQASEMAKFDLSISGDGILYKTALLKMPESITEPQYIVFTKTGAPTNPTVFSSPLLLNKNAIIVFLNDDVLAQSTYTLTNSSPNGVLTINLAVGELSTVKLFYY
jgi:predicted secreted protein